MRITFLLTALLAVGCGGHSTPVPVPPLPLPVVVMMPPCYTDGLAKFPQVKVHTDARGRQFCYDDTEAQADPSLLPLRWDRAGEQIALIHHDVDLNAPFPLNATVFKFMPHDAVGYFSIPYWRISRVKPDYPNQDIQMVGLTTVDTWPIVVYVLAEAYDTNQTGQFVHREPLAVVRHESLHVRWFGWFPDEVCPDGVGRVFEQVEHGIACDPFQGVVQ